MPMKNLDLLKEQKTQIMQRMTDALRSDNPEKFAQAWEELQLNLQDTVMAEARGINTTRPYLLPAVPGNSPVRKTSITMA